MRFRIPAFQFFCMHLLHTFNYAYPKNCLETTENDLRCYNDFESEMKCHLSCESCSEYKLNITQYTGANEYEKYYCVFGQSRGSATDCECKVEVPLFVITEIFETTLLSGVNVLFTKKWETMSFIKPKTPVLDVQKTADGNFRVTWNSKYTDGNLKSFVERLKIKYEIRGQGKNDSRVIFNTVGFDEIITSNLHPNTEYLLTATMVTDYNNYMIESDKSEPVSFTTPPSRYEQLKMIPVVSVVLISVIIFIVISVFSIKRVWWDKISKPKLNLEFGQEKDKTLPFYPVPISNIQAKSDLSKETKWILPSEAIISEKSCDSVDSVSMDYAQTVSGTSKGFNMLDLTEQALKEAFKLHGLQMPMSSSYNQVPVVSENHLCSRDSGNCSATSFFSNLAYLESPGENSSFLEPLSCDPSYMKENSINSDDYPDTSKTQLNDMEMFTKSKLVTSPNPMYPTLSRGNVIVCDNEYQDVRAVSKKNEKWIIPPSTEEALGKCGALKFHETVRNEPSFRQSSPNPSAHIVPLIEMVDSYHPV